MEQIKKRLSWLRKKDLPHLAVVSFCGFGSWFLSYNSLLYAFAGMFVYFIAFFLFLWILKKISEWESLNYCKKKIGWLYTHDLPTLFLVAFFGFIWGAVIFESLAASFILMFLFISVDLFLIWRERK